PFDKFKSADRRITTQMKATGEVMALDRTFAAALMKAVRSLEIGAHSLRWKHASSWSEMELENRLTVATDERLFAVAEGFRRGMSVAEIAGLAYYDPWFLERIQAIVGMEATLTEAGDNWVVHLSDAKELGFPDRTIAELVGTTETAVRAVRRGAGVVPAYKIVDTCAAEFEAVTPYFYSCFDREDEARPVE
ncbi:MAG: carbamoyl-phosphate synthase large subunit, partial [Armatimonadaceae bacterium]